MSDEPKSENLKELVLRHAQIGEVVFRTCDGLQSVILDEFIEQSTEGLLYDLNRDRVTVLSFIDDPKWVNDYAVSLVIEKLKEKLATALSERAHYGDIVSAKLGELEDENVRLKAESDAVTFAAHMPNDYEYGLPSWICQRLYASYIGAKFSDDVLDGIKNGRLTFPDSPIYQENVRLRADNACLRIANEIARHAEVDELREENALLRAALEKRARRGYQYYCPSCGAFSGYTLDCECQTALQLNTSNSGYKSARGVLSLKDDESPEDAVRRLRDQE